MTMKLTSEEYTKQGGVNCPFCGSSNITTEPFDGEAQTQEVYCNDCDSRWYDIYELKGYQTIED